MPTKDYIRTIILRLFPSGFWTGSFTFWWLVSLASVFLFDIFWMAQTTFRPLSYYVFYPVLFLSAFVLAIPSLFTRNGVVQTIWLLIFDLLFIANLMYCRTYYNAIPLQSYFLAGNLEDFHGSVFESFKWYFIFLPLLSIAAFTFYILSKKLKKQVPSPLPSLIYVCILGIAIWAGDARRGGIMTRMDLMSDDANLSSSIPPMYSLAGFLYQDFYNSHKQLNQDDIDFVESWISVHEKFNSKENQNSIASHRSHPTSLVLIICESLESWVIETEVEGREITPNLNRLLKDSTTFYAPNVVTQVGSGRSIEGQLLILTGLMPMKGKVYAYDAADNEFFSLPKAMKANGAKTIEFSPDKPNVWNQAKVAPAFGFEKLYNAENIRIDKNSDQTIHLTDGSLMELVAEKLKNENLWRPGEKAMVMVVTISGHNPFDLPQDLRTFSFSGNYPEIIKDYMVTANYTDASLGTLINYIQSRPDKEDIMVVITGDHEGLAADRKEALNNSLSRVFVDSLKHTPLIILNSPVGGRFNKEMGQADIYATILDLMQLESYPWKGLGQSIFSPGYPGVAVGSTGDVVGDTAGLSPSLIKHLKDAHNVSDKILKFNLLKNYPHFRSER